MTEYDYSPEGYERYMATQSRVSNWVNSQAQCAHQYQSPFVPRNGYTPPSQPYSPTRRSREQHSSRSSSSSGRPEHKRSVTAPGHSTVHKSSRPTYQHSSHSQTYIPHNPPLPRGMEATYKTYTYDGTTKEIVLPPPRPGEQYVIIPPKGRRVEVVSDSNVSRSSSRSSTRSPTKKNPPLLKRLLTTLVSEPKPSSRQGGRTRSY